MSPTQPKALSATDLAAKALTLRKNGASYVQIGRALGVTPSGARRAVLRELHKVQIDLEETAREVKAMEIARIDEIMMAVYPLATKGDLYAVDRVIKLMDRRSTYLGLDAPAKKAITDTEGNDSPEMKALAGAAAGLASLLAAVETSGDA